MKPVVIIGAGGFAREVLDVINAVNHEKKLYDVLGYIVDPQYGSVGTIINEKPILGGFDWTSNKYKNILAICGVGPPHQRYHLVQRAKEAGYSFFSIIHPTAILTQWVQIGEGVVITAGCILTNQIQIGNHVQINLDCTIGHDVVIEDFVTLSPGVHVSGNVTLQRGSYVGTGGAIIEKLIVKEWSTIGAGSVVVKDVTANTTVIGIPAKSIKKKKHGWHLS